MFFDLALVLFSTSVLLASEYFRLMCFDFRHRHQAATLYAILSQLLLNLNLDNFKMKHFIFSFIVALTISNSFGQSLIKIGDNVPRYSFTKIVNAPFSKLDMTDLKGKPAVIAFWGTWCGPCIPEMINLVN